MKRQSKESAETKENVNSAPAATQKPVLKKVSKREEYVVEEPPEPSPRQQPDVRPPLRPVTIHTPGEPMDIEDEPADTLFQFLDRLDRDMGYTLRIDRLPQFAVTGKFGRGAQTVYCGVMQISAQELADDIYLQQIQQLYGQGSYRVMLRDQNSQFIRQWPVTIDAPLDMPRPAPLAPGG